MVRTIHEGVDIIGQLRKNNKTNLQPKILPPSQIRPALLGGFFIT